MRNAHEATTRRPRDQHRPTLTNTINADRMTTLLTAAPTMTNDNLIATLTRTRRRAEQEFETRYPGIPYQTTIDRDEPRPNDPLANNAHFRITVRPITPAPWTTYT